MVVEERAVERLSPRGIPAYRGVGEKKEPRTERRWCIGTQTYSQWSQKVAAGEIRGNDEIIVC